MPQAVHSNVICEPIIIITFFPCYSSVLDKYRPGQSEPILFGREKLLKPALRLMASYRLVVEGAEQTTNYTRRVDSVQVGTNRVPQHLPLAG